MNRKLLLFFLILIGIGFPHDARADDLASTSPEIVPPSVLTAAPDTATSSETIAATANPVTSSTEPAAQPGEPDPVVPPPIQVELAIEAQNSTLFRGPLTVTACAPSSDSPIAVSGYCAIEQSGINAEWSWYGSDAFIDTIGGVGNDYVAGTYWNWFSDLSYGMTSLNAHTLRPGESLIITIGRFPLRIEPAEASLAGSTTTLAVSQFGFDANFDPVWQPAASSTVHVGEEFYIANEAGAVSFVPATSGTLNITATKEGFLKAVAFSLSVDAAIEEPATGDAGGNSSRPTPADPLTSALNFLRLHQRPDGSFASPLLSDWAAIAFASANTPAASLKLHLASASDTLETATDFERRTMALSALGLNPQQEIKEIVARFDGVQVGEQSLINDDIFALIALKHGGYDSSDSIVTSLAASIVRAQQSNGAWTSTDLTAAAIQALAPLSSLPGVSSSVAKARGYLVSRIEPSGCFGNSFTTSWSLMAISALNESPDSWTSPTGETPLLCLRALQAEDGGFEEGASTDTRVWATAYAVPALSGQTWDRVLHTFKKPGTAVVQSPGLVARELILEEKTTEVTPIHTEILSEATPPVLVLDSTRELKTARKASLTFPQEALAAAAIAAPALSAETPQRSFWESLMDLVRFLFALVT